MQYKNQSRFGPALASPLKSRRRFVQGLVGGGLVGAGFACSSWAQEARFASGAGRAPVLSGKTFNLVIEEQPANFTGSSRIATMINGSIPAPTLRWKEGDTVTINVTNRLSQPTSIHWHGIILPFEMDGVPGISYPGIAPGQTFQYRFEVVTG